MNAGQSTRGLKDAKIYLAGHSGLLGSALSRELGRQDYGNVIRRTHADLDLTDSAATREFFQNEKPEAVIMAAARVGGIEENRTNMAELALENLRMACNVIQASHETGVKKLLYIGSACIYPPGAAQPISEESLLGGPFEPTNEGYAIAKTAGIKLCHYYQKQYGDNFVSCIPANIYGERDHFEGQNGHVIPMLIKKIHAAMRGNSPFVEIWGSGKAEREFLHASDAAAGCLNVLENWNGTGPINIAPGETVSIAELAALIKKVTGYEGALRFDLSKPDGMPKRMLDVGKINKLGWKPKICLEDGLKRTWEWYLKNMVGNK